MIENISSNKTWLQLRFVLKNKYLKSTANSVKSIKMNSGGAI